MQEFKSYDVSTKEIIDVGDKNYGIAAMEKIKDNLNATKSKLDEVFSDKDFSFVWNGCDPFKPEKRVVSTIGCTSNVSNAWLKCYEMISHYGFIPSKSNKFVHFDNAAFPGSFVLATHHYVNTLTDWGRNYSWRASSLFEVNQSNKVPLEDKYKLYQNYSNHWLMDEKNNGDVLLRHNQLDFMHKLGHSVDLYTSDLGFDVSSDYNNQELIQCPANIGQILTGILSLKKGGNFITKQYTIFEPITISVIYAVATFFNKFYICKPVTSRTANSEIYLVGEDFKDELDDDVFTNEYVEALMNRMENNSTVPIFDAASYPKNYLKKMVNVANELASSQIEKINADFDRYEQYANGNRQIVNNFKEFIADDVTDWYIRHPVLPISKTDALNIVSAL
jgi:23S rRNA U2552 (ribose-2'-O)-methylase RlmE/FtsJ